MIVAKENFYTILGIPRDANRETIRAAYRDLISQFHPTSPTYKSSRRFTQPDITRAYKTLYDPQLRADYDAQLPPLPPKRTYSPKASARPTYPRAPYKQNRYNARKSHHTHDEPSLSDPLKWMMLFAAGVLLAFLSTYIDHDEPSEPIKFQQTFDAIDIPLLQTPYNFGIGNTRRGDLQQTLDVLETRTHDLNQTPHDLGIGNSRNLQQTLEAFDR